MYNKRLIIIRFARFKVLKTLEGVLFNQNYKMRLL